VVAVDLGGELDAPEDGADGAEDVCGGGDGGLGGHCFWRGEGMGLFRWGRVEGEDGGWEESELGVYEVISRVESVRMFVSSYVIQLNYIML